MHLCPKCNSPMHLDYDKESLVCSNAPMCSHRDYRVTCPLLVYLDSAVAVKSINPDKPRGRQHKIVCGKCGRTVAVVADNEILCWECRTNRQIRKRKKAILEVAA